MDMRTVFEYKCHLLSILQSEVRNKDTAYVTVWFNHKVCSTQKTRVGIIQNKHFIWLETSNLSVHLMLQSHQRKLWLEIAAWSELQRLCAVNLWSYCLSVCLSVRLWCKWVKLGIECNPLVTNLWKLQICCCWHTQKQLLTFTLQPEPHRFRNSEIPPEILTSFLQDGDFTAKWCRQPCFYIGI